RAVERPLLPIDCALGIEFGLERLDDAIPNAGATPGSVAVIDGLPIAVALRNVGPGGAGMQTPEDAVENGAARAIGMAELSIVDRQEGLNQQILFVREFVACHQSSRFIMVKLHYTTTGTGLAERAYYYSCTYGNSASGSDRLAKFFDNSSASQSLIFK